MSLYFTRKQINRIRGVILVGIPILVLLGIAVYDFGVIAVLKFVACCLAGVAGIVMLISGCIYLSGEMD